MEVSERNILLLRTTVGATTLAGAASGRAAATKLLAAVPSLRDPLVLDFTGIELITASAFREAILSIVRWTANDGHPCLLANVDEVTREEGLIAAAQAGTVLLFCRLDASTVDHVEAIGLLEPKLETTLRLVLQLGEADAKAIGDASGEDTVTTAWNNRLVALTRMGLLAERKVGKTKYYSAVVKGMSYGK
jgi:hypothetical protein